MSAAFRLQVKPTFRDILGRFTRANRDLLESRRSLVQDEGRRFVALAQGEAPSRTGKFSRGIRFRTYVSANEMGFTVSLPQPLGGWILHGTSPHVIRARGGRPLAFFWQKGPRGAGTYFFMSVNHPGTKPNPFMDRALSRWQPGARTSLNRIATRWRGIVVGK
jgi:hypothetical protein